MSRLFDDASSHYLENTAGTPVAAVPLTIACWFFSDDLTARQNLVSLTHPTDAGVVNCFLLEAAGNVANDPIRAVTAGTGGVQAVTSTGFSSGVVHHACGVFAASDSRAAFIDGGSKGTNTSTQTPSGVAKCAIGSFRGGTSTVHLMSGMVAEVAIWNVALTDDEVSILAKGLCPLFMRPASLVSYWPLWGSYSPEIDRVGDFPLTVSGATKGDHPRIFYPGSARLIMSTSVVSTGFYFGGVMRSIY